MPASDFRNSKAIAKDIYLQLQLCRDSVVTPTGRYKKQLLKDGSCEAVLSGILTMLSLFQVEIIGGAFFLGLIAIVSILQSTQQAVEEFLHSNDIISFGSLHGMAPNLKTLLKLYKELKSRLESSDSSDEERALLQQLENFLKSFKLHEIDANDGGWEKDFENNLQKIKASSTSNRGGPAFDAGKVGNLYPAYEDKAPTQSQFTSSIDGITSIIREFCQVTQKWFAFYREFNAGADKAEAIEAGVNFGFEAPKFKTS